MMMSLLTLVEFRVCKTFLAFGISGVSGLHSPSFASPSKIFCPDSFIVKGSDI